jgi:nitric oxide reductase NorD protein
MERSDFRMESIRDELRSYPPSVAEEFQLATEAMSSLLSSSELEVWMAEGLAIAKQAVRSWEAASEFFRISPIVFRGQPFLPMLEWARWGGALSQASPAMAVAYFRASAEAIAFVEPDQISSWASLGKGLYKGSWKSASLAVRFFETSPSLLKNLSLQNLSHFIGIIETLSNRSYDVAVECLGLGVDTFPKLKGYHSEFISLLATLSESSWREVKGTFESGARAIPKIERSESARFLQLAQKVAAEGGGNLPTFLTEAADALGQLDRSFHNGILNMAEGLANLAPGTVAEFIKSCPSILTRINDEQLGVWFAEGIRLVRENDDGGLAYFRVESAHSEEVLDLISSGVELDRIKNVVRMYCRALAGATVDIAVTQDLVGKGIGWVSKENPTTEGTTVFLPPLVDRYPTKKENFTWYKVVSTHQVAHLEFGSFEFRLDRSPTLFKNEVAGLFQSATVVVDNNVSEAVETQQPLLTDISRFFDLFEDRKLILDIFTIVEDARLDYLVKDGYAGIRNSYAKVQRDAIGMRPSIEELPAREALMEFLVQLSLGAEEAFIIPKKYLEEARYIANIVRRLSAPNSLVEDSAQAALHVYQIVSQVRNEETDEWESLDIQQEQVGAEDMIGLQEEGVPERGLDADPAESAEQPYQSPRDVEYRGDFKPELTQLLAQLRQTQEQSNLQGNSISQNLTAEQLAELLKRSGELEINTVEGQITTGASQFANNLLKEAGFVQPKDQSSPNQFLPHNDDDEGSLEITEPQAFLYDEWDFRAGDYKPRWCMVREKTLPEGDISFYQSTLQNYSSLIDRVRRQFELLLPEAFRKIKRLPDGEEFDLDAVIEAVVDRKVGISPSEKLYWRRNKVVRDVAVVFLLDMSASTAEAIEDTRRRSEDWDAPEDPGEYMLWLRARRAQGLRRSYKRIIDVEKESTVLLIRALETIGDAYGIYGFSGYGRENVEFYVIKDIAEKFSERVMRRIDKISPLHATRMGPAIRHATRKLAEQEARTRILFLISDGRPQDRGYSREGVEKEYAVHDTKVALTEARRQNITPFCLTVDKSGHDYLKTMMSDMSYEVLDDISQLPERLPYLYRRLTV